MPIHVACLKRTSKFKIELYKSSKDRILPKRSMFFVVVYFKEITAFTEKTKEQT